MPREFMTTTRRRRKLLFWASLLLASTDAFTTIPSSQHSCFASAVPNKPSSSSSTQRHVSSSIISPPSSSSSSTTTTAGTSTGLTDLLTTTGTDEQDGNDSHNFFSRLFPNKRRKQQQQLLNDYERRKQEWASRYTKVESLRQLFGTNKNKAWGDLDPQTARRLYKTLLPRALLELYKMRIEEASDLAPLAYQARMAAKLYARERSTIPTRLLASTFDGLRQWKKYGKFQPTGMTWNQVWSKYETLILQEHTINSIDELDEEEEEELTSKICLKILERSCQTNAQVDQWILSNDATTTTTATNNNTRKQQQQQKEQEERDVTEIIHQLEKDVRELLQPQSEDYRKKELERKASRIQTLRLLVKAKQRMDQFYDTDDEDSTGQL